MSEKMNSIDSCPPCPRSAKPPGSSEQCRSSTWLGHPGVSARKKILVGANGKPRGKPPGLCSAESPLPYNLSFLKCPSLLPRTNLLTMCLAPVDRELSETETISHPPLSLLCPLHEAGDTANPFFSRLVGVIL